MHGGSGTYEEKLNRHTMPLVVVSYRGQCGGQRHAAGMKTFDWIGPGVADGVLGPGINVCVGVGVFVGVEVRVGVGVFVGVEVRVGVAVGSTVTTPPTISLLCPESDHRPPAFRA